LPLLPVAKVTCLVPTRPMPPTTAAPVGQKLRTNLKSTSACPGYYPLSLPLPLLPVLVPLPTRCHGTPRPPRISRPSHAPTGRQPRSPEEVAFAINAPPFHSPDCRRQSSTTADLVSTADTAWTRTANITSKKTQTPRRTSKIPPGPSVGKTASASQRRQQRTETILRAVKEILLVFRQRPSPPSLSLAPWRLPRPHGWFSARRLKRESTTALPRRKKTE
jgi:hypothetical protein